MRSMSSARRHTGGSTLRLTHRELDLLCDRLDALAAALDCTPDQLATMQAVVLPEQFATGVAAEAPARHRPGDFRKVEEMRRRAARGLPVFTDEDAPADDSRKPPAPFALVVPVQAETYYEALRVAFGILRVPTSGGKGARGRELPRGCSLSRVRV
jgi:hypothetical protein